MNKTTKTTTAKAKTAKTTTAKTTEKVEFINVIKNALVARFDACKALDLHSQTKQLTKPIQTTTDAVMLAAQKVLTQTDFNALANTISYCDAKGKGIEQVKSIVKIVTLMRALASDSASILDNNTLIGIKSLVDNDNHASVREMVCAQSKVARQNCDMFSVRDTFKNLAGYSIGTGNSQASQVRQVLNNFGFFEGFVKGQKNNDPTLNEYGSSILRGLVYRKVS